MPSVTRGCGTRIAGGLYLTVGMSRYGRPVSDFILDPPVAIDLEALGVTAVGVTDFQVDGVTHLIDWVGEEFYPNVADFVEEVRRFGLSRHVPRNAKWLDSISSQSRILLVHRKAYINEYPDYTHERIDHGNVWRNPGTKYPFCPTANPEHEVHHGPYCLGLCWEDVVKSESPLDPQLPERVRVREMPSFEYRCAKAPEGTTPTYEARAFMRLPVWNFELIRAADGSHEPVYEELKKKRNIRVSLEDE